MFVRITRREDGEALHDDICIEARMVEINIDKRGQLTTRVAFTPMSCADYDPNIYRIVTVDDPDQIKL